MKKRCYECKKLKLLKCFSLSASKKDGYCTQCKLCHKEFVRKNYLKNKEKVLKQVAQRKEEYRKWYASLKNKPCTDCKKEYPSYVMDFDRLSDKKFQISFAAKHGWAKEKILKEISKCEIVCANCHRIRTHGKKIEA